MDHFIDHLARKNFHDVQRIERRRQRPPHGLETPFILNIEGLLYFIGCADILVEEDFPQRRHDVQMSAHC